jgi:hypothetical protein
VKSEASKLAQLVVAYFNTFGRHVPEGAMQTLDSAKLASMLEDCITSRVPIPDSDSESESPSIFPPGGCCIVIPDPRKGPDGGWLL